MADRFETHEVFNQSSDFAGFDTFGTDPILPRFAAGLPPAVIEELQAYGRVVATREARELARLANVDGPVLRRFDEKGRRIDRVDYHPAYHALMARSAALGLHASAHEGHLARGIRFFLTAGLECGHLCPLTMTNASLAALAAEPVLDAAWRPLIFSRSYDARVLPAFEKTGVTIGMGMTESQGGTDVRANTTRAEADGEGSFRLNGHKWFLSAPMSDAFLMLAQTGDGPTCFLVPRLRGDGTLNGLHLQRLKDKLGNRSNASSEVEIRDAQAWRVGPAGRGVATIIEMVTLTRLDCALASAGLMRAAVAEAVHHCRERKVFGRLLIEQPLMAAVLADMALDAAAAAALALRLAQAFERAAADPAEAAFRRIVTPAAKYWICKSAPALAAEAMECLGGNGYVEDGRLARLYREAPVNAIWEGSGNVMALDLLRIAVKSPDLVSSVLARFEIDRGTVERLRRDFADACGNEAHARRLAEHLAIAAAAEALSGCGRADLAERLVRRRFFGPASGTHGAGEFQADARTLLDDLCPVLR